MPAGELGALLELRMLPGLGDRRRRELLLRHGSAAAVLAAPVEELGEKAAAARGTLRVRERVSRGLKMIERLGIQVLTDGDVRYPAALRELHDPPCVLFTCGRLELLDRPAVAVVGSRRHTEYGAGAARTLAGGLAQAGAVVISGMARGIDRAAHEAALAGGTIGVLGCGIDVVYPPENEALHQRIAAEGLLLSEFAPGEPPLRHHFPQRNRLIAALARGVVVVEASARSGALITVEHAIDLGREVFAVPGPIGRETSAGTNALLRDGARLVADARDILEELGLPVPSDLDRLAGDGTPGGSALPPTDLSADGLALWRAMGEEPLHADDLAASCALNPPAALAALLELELGGHARQLPGKRFMRVR